MKWDYVKKTAIPLEIADHIFKKHKHKIENFVDKQISRVEREKVDRQKANTKKIAFHYAKKMGFIPLDDEIEKWKLLIAKEIIRKVKSSRIRHIDLSGMTGIKRPKITKILNLHLNGTTLDFLINIARTLEISIQISINP